MTTTAAAAGTRRYAGTYLADPAQVRHARAALATLLRDCPLAGDAILIASEFAPIPSCTAPPATAANSPSVPKSTWTTSGSK